MKQSVSNQGSPFVQMRAHSGGTAEAMRSQQAQGSQQAELTAGSEVTEVPEPRGCTAAQGASTQSLSTAVAAAAAVAAALLTLGQRRQDSGGSKSCGTGRGQGTMGLALRLFLLLLLAVALPARAAQAAPLQARGTDWDHDIAYMEKLVNDSMKILEPGEGPPRWKNQGTGDKKSLEAAKHLDQMLSDLERRREMNRKAVLKAPLPGGSRGSLAASAAGREAMAGPVTGGVSARRVFPGPLVDVAHKPSSHPRGPLRGRKKPTKHNKPQEESKQLDQMLIDLDRHREMDQKSFRKAALPGGINGPVLATDTGSEEMPDSATEEALVKSDTNAQNPRNSPRLFCPRMCAGPA